MNMDMAPSIPLWHGCLFACMPFVTPYANEPLPTNNVFSHRAFGYRQAGSVICDFGSVHIHGNLTLLSLL